MARTKVAERGVAREVGVRLAELVVRRPLVVSDRGLVSAGIVDRALGAIHAEKLEPFVYTDTQPNPTVENVHEAVAVWRTNRCDGVVGVGGGSRTS